MGVYTLLSGITGTQSAPGTAQVDANGVPLPPLSNLPVGSFGVRLDGGAGEQVQASSSQGFQVIVTGTSGNQSCTVQPIASNDGVNWFNYGTAIAVSAAPLVAQNNAVGTGFWKYFSAYVTAISGTGAQVKCQMAA
jgi:hypothetical protein